MTTADDLFVEESATPVTRSVALSHLSIELGHLYMDDFRAGPSRLREHFARVRPWARAATEEVLARKSGRVSTCFLVDDYFTKFSSPYEVVSALVAAARDNGLEIDYVARESGCARAGHVDLATLTLERLVAEPAEGANGRPGTMLTGWLTNGQRSPVNSSSAMAPPADWRPPRQSAVRNHSIFMDVELWSGGPDPEDKLWSCPFLAAVWQLQRLGLLRHLGEPIAEPKLMPAEDLPSDWDRMPPIVQLNPEAAAMRAYRTFTPLDSRFLEIEAAVRTILSQVAIDPAVDAQTRKRAQGEGIVLPAETVGRIRYVFL